MIEKLLEQAAKVELHEARIKELEEKLRQNTYLKKANKLKVFLSI